MPDTMSVQVTASLNGRGYNTDQSVTGENKAGSSPTVTAALAGAVTLRTDNDTGEVTMDDAGHGITTGQKVDAYWTTDGVDYQRRNMTVGTVAGAVVPIDGGTGDNLPLLAADIVLKVPQEEGAWAIAGANVVGLAVRAPSYRGIVVVRQSGGTEIAAFILEAGQSYVWTSESGVTNPVTGATIGKVSFSHADVDNSQEMVVDFLYN